MMRVILAFTCLLSTAPLWAANRQRPPYPRFDYEVARAHEIKPHRFNIPLADMTPGMNQLRLTLVVSPTGDVVKAEAAGAGELLKFWPQLQSEVRQWKFTPFEVNGKAATVSLEEYIDLVPPERFPTRHVAAPALRPDSKVAITFERSGCFGSCPSYTVTVSTEGIVFEGKDFVVASGKHTDHVDADQVRNLAKCFIAAGFYSMDDEYSATVTDMPTVELSVSIDGQAKEVKDYVGAWVGMPAVISDLETEVDAFARTGRWVEGTDGLVPALQAEKFNFHTRKAQEVMKEAASRGQAATVRKLLEAGVRLDSSGDGIGWLQAASGNFETLKLLIDAGAGKADQPDKNLALMGAARSGGVDAARALIAYGANPNAKFSKEKSLGSVLSAAARSGNPEMVGEILRYHPNLEERNRDGETAIFAAVKEGPTDEVDARADCVRLLAQAGANLNAQDMYGDTPLHESTQTDVVEELLKLGANVNAPNEQGETPIFTTSNVDAIPLFAQYGADFNIRNKNGQTVLEASANRGAEMQKALREAIQKAPQHAQP